MMPRTHRDNMRVGQMLGSFEGGGAQRLAYNLAIGLGEHVAKSYAIAVRDAGHYARDVSPEVTLAALGAEKRSALSMLEAGWRLRRLLARERIEVLHIHGTGSLPFAVAATMGMRRRPRIAFTWQDSEKVLAETGWRRRRMVWALRNCASVSGSCRRVADTLTTGAKLSNVGIFHGGVPVTPEPAERGPENPGVLWLGRMVPPKDPQALIRAVGALHREGLGLSACLVGKPIASTQWYFDQTLATRTELGLDSVVELPGFVPDDQMASRFARAQIGVQTSHTEGMSIALMEMMMAGLAIIATDVGDTSSAIRDGETGLLIPAKDDGALTNALRRLVSDPDLRRRLGAAAREAAIRDYSIDAMARRALQEYRRVLAPAP